MKKILFKKGFTLIELLVVIAIIAILTAIVTSNFASSKAKSRDAKRISDIAQLQLALALFYDKCTSYPLTNSLNLISTNTYICSDVELSEYISVIPKDPTTNAVYNYRPFPAIPCQAADHTCRINDYVLQAKLETMSNVLNDDVDGQSVYGIDCRDLSSAYYYCVRSY
jgi:prepilin-type N-terminal cleavage/methylation domain-containing protein